MKQLSEDEKVKVINLIFDEDEIDKMNSDGIVEPGKVWINRAYGYRQQLLFEAGKKLIEIAGKTDFWEEK